MGSSRRTNTREASIGDNKGHHWVDPSSINKVVHLTMFNL